MPNSTIDELPPLSDEDVAILYNIVTSAQASRDPPFRALFAAYNIVLAENGIQSDHDQIYFRFLLRMGDGRAKGETLFETFEALLGKLGIQIEVDREGDNIEEITRQISYLHENYETGDAHRPQRSAPTVHSRRASFNSMHNIDGDATRRSGDDVPQRAQRSHSQASIRIVSGSRPSSRPAASALRDQTGPKLQRQTSTGPAHRGRVTSQKPNGIHLHNVSGRHRSSSRRSAYPGLRYPMLVDEHGLHNLSPRSDDHSAFGLSNPHDSFDAGHQQEYKDPVNIPRNVLYRPSLTQMDFDAETFLYHRTSSYARGVLQKWCSKALQVGQVHANMDAIAQAHDWSTLARQAFEQWRAALEAKRQAAETERFFDHLDRRASKARNLFLLTKAFTHWAQSASDQVLRTSLARRHILRTKYFNAWRDISAVNALKVRRQRLKKFFGIWRRSFNVVTENRTLAIDVYRGNLVKKVYWRWFWGFCERRAPLWGAQRLRRQYFDVLIRTLHQRAEMEAWASDFWRHKTKKRLTTQWAERLTKIRRLSKTAEDWRRKQLTQAALRTVEVQAKLAPLAQQLLSRIDTRLAHGLITLWNERAKLSRQASGVNQLRILRNTWTTWNDQLRSHALASRTDDRVLLQALYKWVIATRSSLLQRVLQGKLKRRFLAQWAAKANEVRGSLEQAERRLKASRNRRLMLSSLVQWRSEAQGLRQREQLASDVYSGHVARRTFETLSSRLQHIQQLNRWASDARFYILTTETLKKWQAAMAQHKRLRRREAYVTIRVKVKRSMAQNVLAIWRDKTSHIVGMTRQAEQVYENRLIIVGTQLFDKWRARTVNTLEQLRQADEIFCDHVLRQQLHRWIQRYRVQQELEERARKLNADMVEAVTAGLLRKMNWRIFQFKSQEETATSLRERNERKHFRNMIRYWSEKAKSKRADATRNHVRGFQALRLPPISMSPERQERQGEMLLDEGEEDVIGRAENWTAFDEDFEIGADQVGVGTTPLPGYLRTPSRRTARAKARFALMSATPATAPPVTGTLGVTPFARKLKAQYPGSARRGGKSGAGFGPSGMGRAFEDIAETSPAVGDA